MKQQLNLFSTPPDNKQQEYVFVEGIGNIPIIGTIVSDEKLGNKIIYAPNAEAHI